MQFRKMLMTYFAAYLLIFLMVLCTMIPLSNQIHAISREQVLESNRLRLQRGMTEIENQLSKMTQMSSLMCLDDDLLRLARMKQDEMQVNHSVYTLRVRTQLNYYRGLLDDVEFCVVAFPNNRLFVSDQMISTDYQDVYGTLFRLGDLSAEAFGEYMRSKTASILCIPEGMGRHGADIFQEPLLTFISHGAFNANMSSICSFAFGVKSHTLLENLVPEVFQEGGFAILMDESGKRLADFGVTADEALLSQLSQETVTVNDETYVLFGENRTVRGLRLVIGVPQSRITQSIQILMNFMSMYLLVSVLLSILLCGVYALWHYRSVKKLVTVGIPLTDKPYQNTNGYQYVQDVLEEISHTKNKLAREYSMLDSAYLNNMLMNACLYGVYTQQETEALRKYVGDLPLYCLAVIRYPELFDLAQVIQLELDVQKFLPDEQVIPIRQKPSKSILLIVSHAAEQGLSRQVADCLEKLLAQKDGCRAGVSDGLTGLEMMRQGYQQAQQALRGQEFNGEKSGIALYQATENASILAEIAIMKKLNDLIFSGKREGVTAVFGELNEKIIFTAGITDEQFKELYYSLRLVLQNIARELETDLSHMPPKTDFSYPELLSQLHEDALRLIDFIEARQQRGNEKLYQATLEKMQAQLSDPGLNAARVASEMGYSEKYIFRIVKESSGKSFGELLEKMRISRTEVLLKDTSLSNEAIARETGFASMTTFYRAFRKVHGVTPAVWRLALEKKEGLGREML